MKILSNCGKLEVRTSPIEGYGVFATDTIPAGTTLEEVPFILFPRYYTLGKTVYDSLTNGGWGNQKESYLENLRTNLGFKSPDKYFFKWFPPAPVDGDSGFVVLPLGFGPIYNTSNTNNNADWRISKESTFVFRAERQIEKDEEIRTFYGYFLSENGTTYNCDQVFHFALDMFEEGGKKVHKIKSLRFGSAETFNLQRKNPSAHTINNLVTKSVSGVSIKAISAADEMGNPVGQAVDVPLEANLDWVYARLYEAKNNSAPIIRFVFEHQPKESPDLTRTTVLWKK